MHYIVGQQVLGGNYGIAEINHEVDSYSIWVKQDGEVLVEGDHRYASSDRI